MSRPRTTVTLRRSWLFVPGADETALRAAPGSGADVVVQELEDFTTPARRPEARAMSPDIMAEWRKTDAVTAVRVNPFETCGREDLEAVMRGAPEVIYLPKVAEPTQIVALDAAITALETEHGIDAGSTEIVPNVELARGIMNTYAIARSSPRVTACLVASEDMAADLGAERGRDGAELHYVRQRFHLECVAAGVVSIDCPYTWRDEDGLRAETLVARRFGYKAKSAVVPGHAAIINEILTPAAEDVAEARRIVETYESAQGDGLANVELDGNMLELPTYMTAKRLLARAAEFGLV